MKSLRLILALVVTLAFVLAGCSDSDDDTSSDDDAPTEATDAGDEESEEESPDDSSDDTVSDTPDITATTENGLPLFKSDFSEVCTSQTGFEGATAYDASGAGPHPITLFNGQEGGTWIESAATLPDGWAVEEDMDFEDNSEYASIELVGCAELVEAVGNGTDCELDDDGETIVLEMADATYELTVYAAATGAPVGEPATIEASGTECPFIVAYEEGQTFYTNLPTDEDVVAAIESAVAP